MSVALNARLDATVADIGQLKQDGIMLRAEYDAFTIDVE